MKGEGPLGLLGGPYFCMTLCYNPEDPFQLKTGIVKVWKVVMQNNHSPYVDYEWVPGLNVSSRESKLLTSLELRQRQICAGFHVFISENRAIEYASHFGYKVIELTADMDDFVAADYGEAVFMRLTYDTSSKS